MATKKLQNWSGMDNRQEDAALEVAGKTPSLHIRDAVNVDFTETGRIALREGVTQLSDKPLKYLWQSSLHGDCFAALGHDWVKINPMTWEHEILVAGVVTGPIYHQVLNNRIVMSCSTGLYVHDGQESHNLCIDTPAAPMPSQSGDGSLSKGDYHVAISWLRDGQESALSESAKIKIESNGSININFPLCLDSSVTHVRLYMTEQNGGELRQIEDYPISQFSIQLSSAPQLGRAAIFQYLSPMRSGAYLKIWRGRLLSVQRNILYFSEPMAFHLTDERYNFLQFAQRITFIEPVESGVWIGQVDHVVFLRGNDPKGMIQERKPSTRPISGSSNIVKSEMLIPDIAQGADTAVWLAENGYNLGTSQGQLIEIQSNHLHNITAKSAQLVGFDQKIMAVVN